MPDASPAPQTCPTLTSDAVRLRLHDTGDVPGIVETSNDADSVQWTTVPQPYGDGEAQWWVGHMRSEWEKRAAGDDSGVMGWAIDARDEKGEWAFAGQVEVRPIGGGVGELGLVLHPAVRGRGLMVQAGRVAMEWATTTGGLRVLHWKTAVGNWASRRTGWRLGFRFSDAIPGLMPQERATFDGWIGTWVAGSPIEPAHPWHVPATLDAPAGVDGTGRQMPAVRLRAWADADRPAPSEVPDADGERYMPGQFAPSEPEAFTRWLTDLRTQMATGGSVTWAIVDPATDEAMGLVGLGRLGNPWYPGGAELSYWLFPQARGRGLLHAALVALADHAFTPTDEGGLGLARLSAGCDAVNRGSAEALRRAGFALVGIERASAGTREALDDAYTFELVNAAEHTTPEGTRPQPPAPRPAAVARARDERVLTAPTLTGPRVGLRAWREEDLPALVDAFARGSLGSYAPDADGTRRWVAQRRERMLQGTDVVWGVFGAPGTDWEGQVLGGVNAQKLADRFAPHAVEIGYWTHVEHRGEGVLGDALDLLLPHVMAPVAEGGLGRTQVGAVTHDDNLASQRVLMKAGFRRVGTRAARAAAPGTTATAATGSDGNDALSPRTPDFVEWRLDAGDDRAQQAASSEAKRLHPAELQTTTASGEPLTLSALTTDEQDLQRVVEACRDPQSVHWLGGTGRIRSDYSLADAQGYAVGLANGALSGAWVGWAIRDAGGQVVGMIDVQGVGDRNMIGYWVHPAARRRGIVSAALRRVVQHALTPRDQDGMGLSRLTIAHARGNQGSRRAIERAGFHPVGTMRRADDLGDGSTADLIWYDLLPEELSEVSAPASPASDGLPHPVLEGDGLVLRPFTPADADALAALPRDREHWPFTSVPGGDDPAAAIRLMEERRRAGSDLEWAVVGAPGTPQAGQLLGGMGLLYLDDRYFHDCAEVSYWVAPDHRGTGVVPRALATLLPWVTTPADQGGLGRAKVSATTHEGNVGSQKLLGRAGFVQWGTEPAAHPIDKADPESPRYAITRWHWLPQRG